MKNLIIYYSRRGQNYVNGSVKNLARIVEASGAVIVLTSTWKRHWQRDTRSTDQLHPSHML